jgi:hypothetical protein
MKPGYLELDNLDDRRELHVLLSKLPPADRWRFVRWCCSRAVPAGRRRPVLHLDGRDREAIDQARRGDRAADDRITRQCWGFLWDLAGVWQLDIQAAAVTLTGLVSGRIRWAELELDSHHS